MANNKFNEVLLKLIGEWFENRRTLLDYDFNMLSNLATTTINNTYGQKKLATKKSHSDDEDTETFK